MKKLGFILLKKNYIFSHTHYLSALLCLPALHRNIERKKSDPDHCEALQGMFGMLTRWTQSCMRVAGMTINLFLSHLRR